MENLKCGQIIDYFRRSFKAVDGLWFLKVEEQYGFNKALRVDNEVWKVMPKIQARMIKSFLELNKGSEALLKSLTTKLELEGFKIDVGRNNDGFTITISDCPWLNLMKKSGREKLSETVGKTICESEYSVWASEFDDNILFKLKKQKCKHSEKCVLEFRKK